MNLDDDIQMKIEGEIDAALKMLGEAQPPAGLTSRIHRRLETSAPKSEHARPGWLFWVPAGGAAMAIVLLAILFQAHSTRGKQPSTVEIAKTAATDSASPQLAALQSSPVLASMPPKRQLSVQTVNPRRSYRERGGYRHAANLLSYPLTRQEKLLVEFVRAANPADLQMLNPEYQAKVEAQQKAEFAAYLKSGSDSNKQRTTETAEINQSTQE